MCDRFLRVWGSAIAILGFWSAIAILRFGDVRSLFEGLGKCDRFLGLWSAIAHL
ncbi:MAG: hypothetical protein ACKPA8_02415 [Dolichospermum sp.]